MKSAARRGFAAPKYELRSRADCDFSANFILCDIVYCGSSALSHDAAGRDFAAQNLATSCSGARDRSSSVNIPLRGGAHHASAVNIILWGSERRSSSKNLDARSHCVGSERDACPYFGFNVCGFSAKRDTQKTIFSACCLPLSGTGRLGSEQNPTLGTFCVVWNFLNLHVARDFNNFGSINLKKFDLAALQFANLKKQIRADKNFYKSAEPHNVTSFGRETRVLRRLGFESKILVPHRSYFESEAGAPCGSGLRYRGCEAAQNFKCFAPDFTENFKNFTWSLEAEPVQNFKISASNFTRNFKNPACNSETEPARSFKDQNLAQDFSQNGKSYDQNSAQGFSQSIKNSEQNLPLSFLQSAKNSDQSQNSKHAFAQSHAEQNSVQGFLQSAKNSDQGQNSKHASAQSRAELNSKPSFSQSIKNSDRNSKANSTQDRTEPVSSQELKNSEPCPAQRLGFYAPKFKDERARNFFSHPMRVFVLCACFFAALGALSFLAPDALEIDYVGAHKFYFLFLAPSCIYAAFLLTALPDWTNFEGSLKPVSLAFAACLIAAFIASFLNLRLAAAIAGLFWAVFFIFAAWLLWLDKNSNNFSILAVLAAFCACSAAYGASGDEKFLLSFVHINVAAIAVVSYRISVVIGNEALREGGLKDAVFIPNFIYKNLAAFLAFALALATPFLSDAACGFIALGIGFLFLAKLRELHYAEILSRHYMAFYYALQAACAAGYLWLGAALIRGGYAAAPLHVIAICYMYGAILFVGMIAGQRHSGISPLNFPRLSRAALVLALLAGALRAVFAGESFVLYVMIPSALFIAAVALYLINFIPIFLKNPFSADPD
ncbi:NnrS family protein [uncultured Campylobacter sp.]|uniref:NnrS family protein n=1 Tax=uncultured Campylobacter sp. TaxID=218934 RepID=UPI0026045969|nr:NnrS family protein [uncultured Campylobacter sp.]